MPHHIHEWFVPYFNFDLKNTKNKNLNTLITLECNSKLLDLSTPATASILNLTDDSFYDGGQHNSIKKALLQTEKMLDDGAKIIDIGAYSSHQG